MGADLGSSRHPQTHIHTLRQHVLSPLETAEEVLEREHAEFGAEIEAFREFTERLEAIPPESSRPRAFVKPGGLTVTETTDSMERVRAAYRDTVMAVPHFESAYGESLRENVASELGRELSIGLQPGTSVSFTDAYKQGLLDATEVALERRRRIRATLGRELTAVEQAGSEIRGLLEHVDTVTIPPWYRDEFTSRLDRVVERRQETLHSSKVPSSHSYHTLIEYLYGNRPWNYPVLSAALRLREAVVL